jgi:hypothetical protein
MASLIAGEYQYFVSFASGTGTRAEALSENARVGLGESIYSAATGTAVKYVGFFS